MQTVENAIEQALQDAVEEIDSYVAVKYQLPLPEVPSTLKRIACNIARYRLYFQRPTEEVENRYKAEIDFLKRIADGKATLNILNTQNQVTTEKPVQTPSTMPIGTSYVGGVFGDETLDKMPSFK
ncbi:gp436 family protein [Acinetobacter radioresistens]|uniref:gp436 family protein n=1 Tax=Acinetobacter radioresistens TaxID=40216 RepID=UPI0020059A93|nr:DUF1320 domain-containing protein [Acinetobacter radioresistens]